MEEQTHEFRKRVLRQKALPYAVTSMVFGIVSIAVLCYFGWVVAIVALVLHSKAMKIYHENPPDYKESSLKMLKAARTCGIIGLIVSIVATLFYILYFVVLIGITNHSINF
jgi:predicted secreted protein